MRDLQQNIESFIKQNLTAVINSYDCTNVDIVSDEFNGVNHPAVSAASGEVIATFQYVDYTLFYSLFGRLDRISHVGNIYINSDSEDGPAKFILNPDSGSQHRELQTAIQESITEEFGIEYYNLSDSQAFQSLVQTKLTQIKASAARELTESIYEYFED